MIINSVFALVIVFTPPAMVFDTPSGWVITDGRGAVVRRFTTLAGLSPTDVTISADGSTILFTAARAGEQPLLYRLDGDRATRLSRDDGYHAAPSIAVDGNSIVYVHHSGDDSGPIGNHAPGANAQLWRMPIDGGDAEQLSSSRGCKGAPHLATNGLIVYAHNTCSGQQGIELIRPGASDSPVVLVDQKGFASEPKLAPNGRLIAITVRDFEDSIFRIVTRARPEKPVLDVRIVGHPRRIWPQWSPDSKSVLYVSGCSLFRADLAKREATLLSNICETTDGGLP